MSLESRIAIVHTLQSVPQSGPRERGEKPCGQRVRKMSVTTDNHHGYRPVRQLRRTKGIHKLLFNRLSFSLETAEATIRQLKNAWNPAQMRLRTLMADRCAHGADDETLAQSGYVKLGPSYLDNLPDALKASSQLLDEAIASGRANVAQAAARKEFLVSLIRDEQIVAHPELLRLATSQRLLELATRYFGSAPLLTGFRLWWTPPNSTVEQSQMFHCDREDQRQLKVLINVSDTSSETGPFTLIPAEHSQQIKDDISYCYKHNYVPDDEIAAVNEQVPQIALTGPRGTAYCVDTSRCLHFGSRGNTKTRVIIIMQYTTFTAPNVTVPAWHSELRKVSIELSELQQLALGVTQS